MLRDLHDAKKSLSILFVRNAFSKKKKATHFDINELNA